MAIIENPHPALTPGRIMQELRVARAHVKALRAVIRLTLVMLRHSDVAQRIVDPMRPHLTLRKLLLRALDDYRR